MTNEFNTILTDRVLSKTVSGTIIFDSPVDFNDAVNISVADTENLKVDNITPYTGPLTDINITCPTLNVNANVLTTGAVNTPGLLTDAIDAKSAPAIQVGDNMTFDLGRRVTVENITTKNIASFSDPLNIQNTNVWLSPGFSLRTDNVVPAFGSSVIRLQGDVVEVDNVFEVNTVRSNGGTVTTFTDDLTVEPGNVLRTNDIRAPVNATPMTIGTNTSLINFTPQTLHFGGLAVGPIDPLTNTFIQINGETRFFNANGIYLFQMQNFNNANPINCLAPITLSTGRALTCDTTNTNTLTARTGTTTTVTNDLSIGANKLLYGTQQLSEASSTTQFENASGFFRPLIVPRFGMGVLNNTLSRTQASSLIFYTPAIDPATINVVSSNLFTSGTSAPNAWTLTYSGPSRFASLNFYLSLAQSVGAGNPNIVSGVFRNTTFSAVDGSIAAANPYVGSTQRTQFTASTDQKNLTLVYNGPIQSGDVFILGFRHSTNGASTSLSYLSVDCTTIMSGIDNV